MTVKYAQVQVLYCQVLYLKHKIYKSDCKLLRFVFAIQTKYYIILKYRI